MDLQKVFDEMLVNPIIMQRINETKETVETNRTNLVNLISWQEWNENDLRRAFIDIESHTAKLIQRKLGEDDFSAIKGNWSEFRSLFIARIIENGFLNRKGYNEICAFFEKLNIRDKTPAINRIILNFCNFNMVCICTEAHMRLLVKLLNSEFGYREKHIDWLQSADNVLHYFKKNLDYGNKYELVHLGWHLLEMYKLVPCEEQI